MRNIPLFTKEDSIPCLRDVVEKWKQDQADQIRKDLPDLRQIADGNIDRTKMGWSLPFVRTRAALATLVGEKLRKNAFTQEEAQTLIQKAKEFLSAA